MFSLKGIDLVDDLHVRADGYPEKLPVTSIGMLPFSIAPHWDSDHPESALIGKAVEYFVNQKMPFITLRDGEVYMATLREMPNHALHRMPTSGGEL